MGAPASCARDCFPAKPASTRQLRSILKRYLVPVKFRKHVKSPLRALRFRSRRRRVVIFTRASSRIFSTAKLPRFSARDFRENSSRTSRPSHRARRAHRRVHRPHDSRKLERNISARKRHVTSRADGKLLVGAITSHLEGGRYDRAFAEELRAGSGVRRAWKSPSRAPFPARREAAMTTGRGRIYARPFSWTPKQPSASPP
jgi:hypothetical protein